MDRKEKIKIGLLGSMDSGKSMLAAAMLDCMIYNANKILAVSDYTLCKDMGHSDHLFALKLSAINEFCKIPNRVFAMQGNHGSKHICHYDIKAVVPGQTKSFLIQLIDIPGSFLNGGLATRQQIVDILHDCDTIVVVVDTPYLMHEYKVLRDLGNKMHEVPNILESVTAAKNGKLQVIFAPVKCEKWMHCGKIIEVTTAVEREYAPIISKLQQYSETEISIIPSETIGVIEFNEFRKVYLLLNTTTNSMRCCSLLADNIVSMMDGRVVKVKDDEEILEEAVATFAYDGHPEIFRPMQWYSFTRNREAYYRPYNCEQVMLHSIRYTFNSILKAYSRSLFAPIIPINLIGNMKSMEMNYLLREMCRLIKDATDGIRIIKTPLQ